jgi:hypothetical protein
MLGRHLAHTAYREPEPDGTGTICAAAIALAGIVIARCGAASLATRRVAAFRYLV